MRVGALSAFEEDVGVLVGTAVLTKNLSYLLVQSQRERERECSDLNSTSWSGAMITYLYEV